MSNEGREPIRVSLEEAKEAYDEGNITVLDAVDTGTYEELSYKIEGAVRIAPEDIGEEYDSLPKNKAVYAY